ncbi:hypothetical protein ACWAT4_24160 [Bradyrhizobium manausense]
MLTNRERTQALGEWGERRAFILLERAGFVNVRNINAPALNHPFADLYAERRSTRYLVGVKTRNKFQVSGMLNPTYNVKKRGADVAAIAARYEAELAWVALQVVPELQIFWGYFGTIKQIEDKGERFSIPMRASDTSRYECLADKERDGKLLAQWSNGGFTRSRERPL